ncbi:MAG: NUDIX hydrolase [Anaerolineae bacterium]
MTFIYAREYWRGALRKSMKRSRFPVAVHLLFLSGGRVLLLRRFNTGWGDGKYSVPAGHVDAGESVIAAAIREAWEEVGVCLRPADLEVVHVMHRKSDDERIDFFLLVKGWAGEIANREPDKCDDLRWFSLSSLPSDMIPYVKSGLRQYQAGIVFSEFGW